MQFKAGDDRREEPNARLKILMVDFINHLAELVRAWPEPACVAAVHIVPAQGAHFKEDAPPDFIFWRTRDPKSPEPFLVLPPTAVLDLIEGHEIHLTAAARDKNLQAFGDRIVEILQSCREGAIIILNPSNGFMPWSTFFTPNAMSIGATTHPDPRPGTTYRITWTALPGPNARA